MRAKSPDEGEDEEILIIQNTQHDMVNVDAGRGEEKMEETIGRDRLKDGSLDPRLSRISVRLPFL